MRSFFIAFALLSLLTLATSGCSSSSTEDLSKLTRPQKIQKLRAQLRLQPDAKAVWADLASTAFDEGDALTAIEALEKSQSDPVKLDTAKSWMDPARFPQPLGDAAALYSEAVRIQLTADAPFATRVEVMSRLNRAGRLFFDAGNRDAANECIQRMQGSMKAILATARPSLLAYHLAADHDELYGDMLAGNRHWGNAREFYQNNVMRFKAWDPPNDYTRRRLSEARAKVAQCEKKMMP